MVPLEVFARDQGHLNDIHPYKGRILRYSIPGPIPPPRISLQISDIRPTSDTMTADELPNP
jgi:hypothetical protein